MPAIAIIISNLAIFDSGLDGRQISSLVPLFAILVRLARIPGIEIRHDDLTRFVDKLLDRIGGIAVCLDGVTDNYLYLPRLHHKLSLGQHAPTAIDSHRQDGDFSQNCHHESPLFEFLDPAVGGPGAFGKDHDACVMGQPFHALVDALDGPGGIGAVEEYVPRGVQRVPEDRDFEDFLFGEPAELNAQRCHQREDVVLRLVVGDNDIRLPLDNPRLVFYLRADKGDGKHGVGPDLRKGEGEIAGTA